YFSIQGLQPHRHYQLTARTITGQTLSGVTWATPPDAKVLIRVSSDFNTPDTPPAPPARPWPGNASGGPTNDKPRPAPQWPAADLGKPTPAAPPAAPSSPGGGVGLGTPIRSAEPAPSAPPAMRPPSGSHPDLSHAVNTDGPGTVPPNRRI